MTNISFQLKTQESAPYASERGKPVVTTYYRNYHSVRNERFRLIQYPDGTGEFYDIKMDKWEWKNLYLDPDYAGVRKSLD